MSDGPRRFQAQLALLAAAIGLPATAIAIVFLYEYWPPGLATTASLLLIAWWALLVRTLTGKVVGALRSLANLIESLRRGELSRMATRRPEGDVLGEVYAETNRLAKAMKEDRLDETRSNYAVGDILASLDIPVMTFDAEGRLLHANRAAGELVEMAPERLVGKPAAALGLDAFLEPGLDQTVDGLFSPTHRFRVQTRPLRQEGQRALALTLVDLSKTLREEERRAWKRLIRVMGHEVNNAMAPVVALAQALADDLDKEEVDRDAARKKGRIIHERATALTGFMRGLSTFAKLPPPTLRQLRVADLATLVVDIAGIPVTVETGPDIVVAGDQGQLAQLLQNVTANAREAGADALTVSWERDSDGVLFRVRDNGRGLGDTENLFTPFFSTKKGGSGIGLLVARQVAEGHGGHFDLRPGTDGGAEAQLRLPG
ncbi:MAG: ATP-binding protein [Pseudomonadota bacterium]